MPRIASRMIAASRPTRRRGWFVAVVRIRDWRLQFAQDRDRSYEDMASRYLSGDQHPDYATLAEFRKRHLTALDGLFTQALLLCAKAGLVKLGHEAIDGTKIKANASKQSPRRPMSYKRMTETEARLEQQIEELLRQAEKSDAAEDVQYGKKRRGDELLDELSRCENRLQKIRAAKAALEDEAREKAEHERAETDKKLAECEEEKKSTGKKKRGRKPQPADPDKTRPADKSQRNFTDPESRIMPDGANKAASCRPTMRRSRLIPPRR